MSSPRVRLTPQMLQYDDFDDRGQTRWLPYLMYFHRAGYTSPVINTDPQGFRYSHSPCGRASAGSGNVAGPMRLLVGSSTAFGIGVTSDQATIASRLWTSYASTYPWLNFAGRSFNSTQEAILFLLHHHQLPEVAEIVVFSGLNDLALSRLPAGQRGDHGGFFNCGEYFQSMERIRAGHRQNSRSAGWLRQRKTEATEEEVLPLGDRIALAVDQTARNLDSWRALAPHARISYVLQPLATWVRDEPAPQEREIFAELDAISNFWELYGDIATMSAGRTYAAALSAMCSKRELPFHDLSPVLADVVAPDEWLYVDRAHFTDHGSDLVARHLAELLDLS